MADCLGGCGVFVGPGQRCQSCATVEVQAWVLRRDARKEPAVSEAIAYKHSCGYVAQRKGLRKNQVVRECGYCHGELEPAVTVR